VKNDLAWADLDILAPSEAGVPVGEEAEARFCHFNGNFRAAAYDSIPYTPYAG
jgi:hypothetical protein